MKRLLLLFSFLLTLLQGFSQGWPAKYQGVMLQGFYWDSYEDSQWTKLQSQADVISQSFNSIWYHRVVSVTPLVMARVWATTLYGGSSRTVLSVRRTNLNR